MNFIVPLIILLVLAHGYVKGIKVYDAFIEGARDGLLITVKILPYIAAMLLAVGMLRRSGGLDFILYVLRPLTDGLGIPEEVMPLIIMKSLSGSGALGVLADILKNTGADSFAGVLASIIMSSTETIFYTITVYYGSIGIRNIRHTIAAALIAELTGISAAILLCRLILFR